MSCPASHKFLMPVSHRAPPCSMRNRCGVVSMPYLTQVTRPRQRHISSGGHHEHHQHSERHVRIRAAEVELVGQRGCDIEVAAFKLRQR